jgi:hypothetical protein
MASQLEFDTVLHVLDKHLSPACSVLDLTDGSYTPHLTRRGFRISTPEPRDATRLDLLSDKNFHAVLCLGPYCRERSRDKRRRCLLECRRMVSDGGFVAVLYLNRAFALGDLLRGGVHPTEAQYRSLYQHADADVEPLGDGAHLTSPEEVDAEVRSCGFAVAEHVGVDGVYGYFPDALDSLDTEAYQNFLWYHLRTCGQPSARGHSRHGLVVLRKE